MSYKIDLLLYIKGFFIFEKKSSSLRNVPLNAKEIINAEILHKKDLSMTCYRKTLSDNNTLKIITICFGF